MIRTGRGVTASAVALAGGLVLVLLTSTTQGGLTASVTNSADTATSGRLAVAATPNTGPCDTAPTAMGSSTAACNATTLPATTPATGTSAATSTTLSNTGTVTATAATLQAQSCGPVQLANSRTSGDPMLVRGGISYAQSAPPVSASSSLLLGGVDGLAVENSAQTINQTTIGIWFKVPTTSTGGPLLGLGSSPATGTETIGRVLWLDGTGHLNFTFIDNLGGIHNTTTTATYRDNAWHFVAATLVYGLVLVVLTPFATATLYIDGATGPTTTVVILAAAYAGYAHVGWTPMVGVSGYTGAVNNFLAGNVANAFTENVALTPAQLATLAGSATPAQWQTNLAAVAADNAWTLSDSGTATFAGPYPTIGAVNPCSLVTLKVTVSSTTTTTLAGLVTSAVAISPPTTTTATVVSLTTARGSGYDATYVPGLHLYAPMTVSESVVGWTTTLTWAAVNQQVIA